MNPQFPIYIVSYKRWDSRLTVKALDSMKVPYKVIVDKIDYDKYANVIPEEKLLVLPPEYREQYDTFDKSLTTTGVSHDIASAVLEARPASDNDVDTYISELLNKEGNN